MTALAKRCWQVWQSWSHWPVYRLACWIMVIQWIGITIETFWGYEWRTQGLGIWLEYLVQAEVFFDHIVPVLLAVAIPVMIVWRVKHQMMNWRAALTPHYRATHLLVAGLIAGMMFSFMVVGPLAFRILVDFHWGVRRAYSEHDRSLLIAFALSRATSMAWLLLAELGVGLVTAFASLWLVIAVGLIMLVWFTAQYLFHTDWYYLYATGHYDLKDVNLPVLLMWDALLLTGLCLRLLFLPVGLETIRADERVPWLSAILVKTKSRPAGGLFNSGIWRRAGHRRLMGLGRRFVWLTTLYVAAILCIRPALVAYNHYADSGEFAFDAFFLTGVVSALALGLSWPRHFTELSEVELMRPAPRRDCAKEIGVAMFFDAAELYLTMLLAILLITGYWLPSSFRATDFWHIFAAASFSQFLTFGLLVWATLLRSPAASLLALALAIIALTMLLYIALNFGLILPSAIAAAAGIILTAHEYRRWLRADMA